jgi:YD repeat-containing protein
VIATFFFAARYSAALTPVYSYDAPGWDSFSYDGYRIGVQFAQGSAPDGDYNAVINGYGTVNTTCTGGTCSGGPIWIAVGKAFYLRRGQEDSYTVLSCSNAAGCQYSEPVTFGVQRVDAAYDGQPDGWVDVLQTITVSPAATPTPTPTPSATPTPTPGTNLKCNDHQSGGDGGGCASCHGMARYSVHSMLVSLHIQDTPLRYSPAYGPSVDFSVTYNQRDSQQPASFAYSNLGPKWTFGWLSYVSDDPNTQLPLTSLYRSGGGAEIFSYDAPSQTFIPDAQSHAMLVKTGPASYERQMPDGSKEVFGLSDSATSYPRRIFLTQVIDPAGNTLTINYDTSVRVTSITDALDQVTTLSYELPNDPLKITKVTDPFGRFATFAYTNGQLTTITDEIGIQSSFGYAAGSDFINALTTPYGTTTFTSGENGTNRWLEATDPLGGKERVEYRDNAPGIAASDSVAPAATAITNAGLDVANTFYWDKKAMLVAPGDYTRAEIKHWLYNADGSVSGILSSEKQPLENRVWYTYAGQLDYQHAGPSANSTQTARAR